MLFAFEALRKTGTAALVLKGIILAILTDLLLLSFIFLRRTYRKRYFAKRDARTFEIRGQWNAIISADIPYDAWRRNALDRRIIETIVLDSFEAAGREESARLLHFLRASGLIEKRIFEARHHRGWRRGRALVALGRTRAPEGIPALSEGLRDKSLETRLAALRGLGRTAAPEAAEEILHWLSEAGLTVPALPLQSALIQCCAERPRLLLPYLEHAETAMREVLGRVLGEVATAGLGIDLLPFADDDIPELRATAARALAQAEPTQAMEALIQLAGDSVWFVRLRAIVSLGKMKDTRALSALLLGVRDSNRLVRLRAAESLVTFTEDKIKIFEQVVETKDRYALHAYLTALDNAGLQGQLEQELITSATGRPERTRLLELLRTSSLLSRQVDKAKTAAAAGPQR